MEKNIKRGTIIVVLLIILIQLPATLLTSTSVSTPQADLAQLSSSSQPNIQAQSLYPTLTFEVLQSDQDLLKVRADLDCSTSAYEYDVFRIIIYLLNENWHGAVGYFYNGDFVVTDEHYYATLEVEDPQVGTTYLIGITASVYLRIGPYWLIYHFYASGSEFIELSDPLEALRATIEESPLECWRNPAERRRTTMLDKVDEVIALRDSGAAGDAYDKLLHDIKPKLTGLKGDEVGNIFGDGLFKNAWIVCPTLGQELTELVDLALTSLNISPVI